MDSPSKTVQQIIAEGPDELAFIEALILMQHPKSTINGSHTRVPPYVLKHDGYDALEISSIFTWKKLGELGVLSEQNGETVMTEEGLNILRSALREHLDEDKKKEGTGRHA